MLPFFFFFFNDTATTEIYTLSLHDALPIRAAASAVAQVQTQRSGDRGNNAAALASMIVTLGSVLMSGADDRTWRTLPADISIARARLPAGVHSVTIQTPQG